MPKTLLPPAFPFPAHLNLGRRNSFDPTEEEEEELEGPEADFMTKLKQQVGPDNYLRPQYGASTPGSRSPLIGGKIGQRRDSGVPVGYMIVV